MFQFFEIVRTFSTISKTYSKVAFFLYLPYFFRLLRKICVLSSEKNFKKESRITAGVTCNFHRYCCERRFSVLSWFSVFKYRRHCIPLMLVNFCRSFRSAPLFLRARKKKGKKFASAAARNFRGNELGFIYRSNYWRDVREAGRRDIYRVSGNRSRANARRWRQKLLRNYTQSRNVMLKTNKVRHLYHRH